MVSMKTLYVMMRIDEPVPAAALVVGVSAAPASAARPVTIFVRILETLLVLMGYCSFGA